MSSSKDDNRPILSDCPKLRAHYNITRLLGEGGMGLVYYAEHPITGHKVAIKALREELCSNSTFRARFLIEAQALSRLDHPNITHLINFIEEDDGRLFLIMQYVAGETLEQFIERHGPVPPAVSMTIMHQILNAFGYAHLQGVIHRDIKPSNIVLTPNGLVKVMDFGIARIDTDSRVTSTDNCPGSPAYMAPEQILDKTIDLRCDIYSLGVLLFEMVTARLPFLESNRFHVMRAHVENIPPDPRDIVSIPDDIAEAILWALEKSPYARPSSTSEFASALPKAEHLGGSDSASWNYILMDKRSIAEIPIDYNDILTNKANNNLNTNNVYTFQSQPNHSSLSRETVSSTPKVVLNTIANKPKSSPFPAVVILSLVLVSCVLFFVYRYFYNDDTGKKDSYIATISTIKHIKDSEMVLVPYTDMSFYIDRTEVTYRQYKEFINNCPVASDCGPKNYMMALNQSENDLLDILDYPVNQITYNDAESYCKWLGKRLPTSDEWGRAAIGNDGRKYPWGNDSKNTKAWLNASNSNISLQKIEHFKTISVHSRRYYMDEGPYGIMGLGGNLSEWLSTKDPKMQDAHLVAGGSWNTYDVEGDAKSTDRFSQQDDVSSATIGFRCAIDAKAGGLLAKSVQLDLIKNIGKIRIGLEDNNYPMFFNDKDGNNTGFEKDFITHITKSFGVSHEVVFETYPDLPVKLRARRFDIIVSAYAPSSFIANLGWSNSYFEYALALLVSEKSDITNISQLSKKKLGYFNDASISSYINNNIPNTVQKIVYEDTTYLSDLSSSRIDAFVYDYPFILSDLKKPLYKKYKFKIAEYALTDSTYNVITMPGEWSLIKAINESIWSWRSSPDYATSISKYLNINTPKSKELISNNLYNKVVVEPGDTLSIIAKRVLFDKNRWKEIWLLNRDNLQNQNLLFVGSQIYIPK